MVLLAAFNLLAQQISGSTDLAIDTLTTGRNDPRFRDTVGPLMNFLVYRTEISGCTSFREVLARTRDTCVQAGAHEVPIQYIEQEVPELMRPNTDPRKTHCIVGIFPAPFDADASRIADSTREILPRSPSTQLSTWIPHGMAWSLHLTPSGELAGQVQFSAEELDERRVAGWAAGYQRILTTAARNPDQSWRPL
jgi:non-ribosomal peptide synthetase component F